MPTPATLIFYGLIGIALLAFVAAGNNILKHHYVDPEQALWDKKEAAYKSTIGTQDTTIRTQGSSLADISRKAGECTASVARIASVAEEAGKQLATERSAHAVSDARKQSKIDELTAIAKGPPRTGDVCEKARAIGAEYARDVRAK